MLEATVNEVKRTNEKNERTKQPTKQASNERTNELTNQQNKTHRHKQKYSDLEQM